AWSAAGRRFRRPNPDDLDSDADDARSRSCAADAEAQATAEAQAGAAADALADAHTDPNAGRSFNAPDERADTQRHAEGDSPQTSQAQARAPEAPARCEAEASVRDAARADRSEVVREPI